MPLTERLLELTPFMIRRLPVVERVRQREAGQGFTDSHDQIISSASAC
jgi:hypothetical protein